MVTPSLLIGAVDLFKGAKRTIGAGPPWSVISKTPQGTLSRIKGTVYVTLAGNNPSVQLQATADGTNWFVVGLAFSGMNVKAEVETHALAVRGNLTAGTGSLSVTMILVTETSLKEVD